MPRVKGALNKATEEALIKYQINRNHYLSLSPMDRMKLIKQAESLYSSAPSPQQKKNETELPRELNGATVQKELPSTQENPTLPTITLRPNESEKPVDAQNLGTREIVPTTGTDGTTPFTEQVHTVSTVALNLEPQVCPTSTNQEHSFVRPDPRWNVPGHCAWCLREMEEPADFPAWR